LESVAAAGPALNLFSEDARKMTTLIQQIINGLAVGSIYSLIAIAWSMIFSGLDLFNFALSEYLMIGAFVAITLINLHIPFPIAFLLTIGCIALMAYLLDLSFLRRLRHAPHVITMIATVGLGVALKNAAILIWGTEGAHFPSFFGEKGIPVMGVYIVPQNLWIFGIALFYMAALYLFLYRSALGARVRAAAQLRTTAGLMGINVKTTDAVITMIGGMSMVIGGILVAPIYYTEANMGNVVALKGFAAAVLGGFGNLFGAMIGGLLLGLIENLAVSYISSQYLNIIAYLVLIIVLLLKPDGLLGKGVR
jgi:branched-chain amino acid transport system permease protein